MLKKLIISIVGFVMALSITALAEPYINLTTWYDGGYEHASMDGINEYTGEVMWSTYLGAAQATELEAAQYLGNSYGNAYVLFDGAVYMIDPYTGYINWVNPDFGGRSASWAFSSSGKLYMCGYYGPDFYVMDSYGNTLSRVHSLSDYYFWPNELYFTYGDNICLVYSGSVSGDGYYPLEFDVTKYFGVVQY
ncbi:hypothetical protein UYO_0408 [Lachnospiraceae bacterium JC7]|nr:hypothetical protein UYO_0408 [Lachnospiraceae bacterium JC7]